MATMTMRTDTKLATLNINSCGDAVVLGRFFAKVLQFEHAAVSSLPAPPRIVTATPYGTVWVLTLVPNSISSSSFVRLCSALPFARSVRTLSLEDDDDEGLLGSAWKLNRFELSWLMYAVFHPKSSSSSFQELDLDNFDVTHNTKKTLERMRTNTRLRLSADASEMTLTIAKTLDSLADTVQLDEPNDHLALVSATSLAELTVPHAVKSRGSTKRKRDDTVTPASKPTGVGMQLARVKANTTVRLIPKGDSPSIVTLQCESELEICETPPQAEQRLVLFPALASAG